MGPKLQPAHSTRYGRFFFPAPSTMAVFLCALALLTLMKRPVIALRPMPAAFFGADFRTVLRWGAFFAMVPGLEPKGTADAIARA